MPAFSPIRRRMLRQVFGRVFHTRVGKQWPSVGKTIQAGHPGIAFALIPAVESGAWKTKDKDQGPA